jgi:glycosyltransferase involved in cell wall biosynthesis
MNWKSYDDPVQYDGVSYGHKNIEFEKFKSLPQLVSAPLEMAVSALKPTDQETVKSYGWLLENAQEVTFSFDRFRAYLRDSKGEFSVCKNMYTATNSGWFSDKSAAYMACGRPVIVQETGFSDYLPVGEGLFAVNNVEEAKEAIETIEGNYKRHSEKAFELAAEYLEAKKVLSRFLNELGV